MGAAFLAASQLIRWQAVMVRVQAQVRQRVNGGGSG